MMRKRKENTMKILWIHNIIIPQIAKKIGASIVPTGGWMVKLADDISSLENCELTIACPFSQNIEGMTERLSYFTFKINASKVTLKSDGNQDSRIRKILKKVNPDIIHIFGTEFKHSYLFSKIAGELGFQKRVVVSIQGLVSVYSNHFEAYLPIRVIKGKTLRDYYKGNILEGKKSFERSGCYEKEIIKNVLNVIGRTDWDKAFCFFINPQAHYYFNNETLRESFYISDIWRYENCNKHSVFMSQATFPLKGLHIALEAIKLLKPLYPDISLRIAGKSYYSKAKIKLSYYEKYILNMIEENSLRDVVEFTGFLDEKKMVDEYKKSNVFVSASSIENSPNSVGEAMLLGVPVVSSYVGGVYNMVRHGVEGFLYAADEPGMLAYYIREVFEQKDRIEIMTNKARNHALKTHDPETNMMMLTDIYRRIMIENN